MRSLYPWLVFGLLISLSFESPRASKENNLGDFDPGVSRIKHSEIRQAMKKINQIRPQSEASVKRAEKKKPEAFGKSALYQVLQIDAEDLLVDSKSRELGAIEDSFEISDDFITQERRKLWMDQAP